MLVARTISSWRSRRLCRMQMGPLSLVSRFGCVSREGSRPGRMQGKPFQFLCRQRLYEIVLGGCFCFICFHVGRFWRIPWLVLR